MKKFNITNYVESEPAGATVQETGESTPQAAETITAGRDEYETTMPAAATTDAGAKVTIRPWTAIDAVLAGGCFRGYIDGLPGTVSVPQPAAATVVAAPEPKAKRVCEFEGRKHTPMSLEEIAADSDCVNVYAVYILEGSKGKYRRINMSAGNVATGCLESYKGKERPMQIRERNKGVVYEWAPTAEPVQEEAEPVQTEPAQAEQLPAPPETVTAEPPRRNAWDALKAGFRKFATAMCFI